MYAFGPTMGLERDPVCTNSPSPKRSGGGMASCTCSMEDLTFLRMAAAHSCKKSDKDVKIPDTKMQNEVFLRCSSIIHLSAIPDYASCRGV